MTTPESGAPLRVGVVGAGGIAQMMHLPHLTERPDRFQIVCLADQDAEATRVLGQRYGVSRLYAGYEEVCAAADVDAVLLFTSGSHRAAAVAALRANKHLFVEKPLGHSPSAVEEIATAARESRGTTMVGYHKRFDPHYRAAREAVRAMSDLRYVQVTVLHPDDGAYRAHHTVWPRPDERSRLPSEEETRTGALRAATTGEVGAAMEEIVGSAAPHAHRIGALLATESLIHDLNALRGILGEPEAVVSASVWLGGFAQSALVRFGGDVMANISWVFLPGLRNYEETLRFVSPTQRVTLTFPSPYLRNFPTPLVVERDEAGTLVVEARTVSYDEAFRAEIEHFHGSVVNGSKPELGVEEAVGDARFIQMLAKAWQA
jgi:predicted dehydrogenase